MTTRIVKNPNVEAVVNKIGRLYRPEKLILFGSWAWGSPRSDSDIDLLVIKQTTKSRIDRERTLRSQLIGSKLSSIDVIILTPEELSDRVNKNDFFIRDIVNRGITVYAKKRTA